MNIEEISPVPIIGYEVTRMNLIEDYLTRITKSKKTRNQTKNKNNKNHNETILTYIHITQNKYYTYGMDQKIEKPVATIVLPTYNEAGNIGKMIDELHNHTFPTILDWQMKILVVDGKSTDNTRDIVKEKMDKYNDVYLFLEDKKEGIGAAYMNGFKLAIETLGSKVVMEFDADFQHPLNTIPEMLNKISAGYDYVIGSRKIPGGSETKERNFLRSLLTNAGSFVARIILFYPKESFKKVTDPTSGLRAVRSSLLSKIELSPQHLYSKKFGYKLQLLKELFDMQPKYTEIPLQFQNRNAGKSKFELDTIFEILYTCFRTRLTK